MPYVVFAIFETYKISDPIIVRLKSSLSEAKNNLTAYRLLYKEDDIAIKNIQKCTQSQKNVNL